jgi:protein-disulfide isomerase
VLLVEYGDFECPFCGRAEESLTTVLNRLPAQVRYVWRHLPLVDVHPQRGAPRWLARRLRHRAPSGRCTTRHAHRADLEQLDLVGFAASLGLDADQFVADFESARLSGAASTPTLFINDIRHEGDYGPAALLTAARMVLQSEDERPQAV